ncbi:MAG: SpoIID/LytB domain-containing protein [Bacillota bacterium]
MKNKTILIILIFFILTGIFSSVNYNIITVFAASQNEDIDPVESYYNGNYKEAINYYENLLNQNKATENDLKNLAFIYKEKGELEKVISIYLKLLKNTNDKYYNYLIGKYNYQLSNYSIADFHFQKLLDSENNITHNFDDINEENFYYILANNYIKLNDYNQAESMFLKGININKDFSLNYLGLANLYKLKGDISKSINYFEKVIAVDNNITKVYPNLAESYEKINNESLAYEYWKKSLNTGKSKDLAQKKIKELQEKFPFLKEKEEAEKKLKRDNIEWMNIKKVPQNKNLKNIKIGIVDDVDKISFQSNKDFRIINGDKIIVEGNGNEEWSINRDMSEYRIYKNDNLIKTIETNNNLKIESKQENSIFIIYDIAYGQGYFWAGSEDRQYRGNFELYTLNSKKFNLINKINMAEYLYSVVPAEMPALWPLEALKAQTIAARSYTLRHFNRHLNDGYNLCDSVHCAAYNGIKSEHDKTNKAVNETLKEAAYYNGRVIDAVFSSNCGGYCESSEDVWGNKNEYLSGVSTMIGDEYDFPLSPNQLNNWLKSSPPSYSNGELTFNNVYRWTKTIDVDFLKERFKINVLKNIIVKERSKGGSVKSVEIKGRQNGTNKDVIRTVDKDYIRSSLGGLRSNRFIIDKIYDREGNISKLIVYGAGWGHNVGMDQSAAATMAEKGYNYKEIIKFFYKDSDISNYNLQ